MPRHGETVPAGTTHTRIDVECRFDVVLARGVTHADSRLSPMAGIPAGMRVILGASVSAGVALLNRR